MSKAVPPASSKPRDDHNGHGESVELPSRPGFRLTLALAAGLLAGISSWAIGEAVRTTFRPPLQRQEVMGQVIMKASFQDQAAADSKNATLTYALLGIVLGGCMGLAGGLARGSITTALKAALGGGLLAGSLAACATWALLPVFFRAKDRGLEELSRDIVLPTLMNGGIWVAAGLGAGAAFGLGLGGRRDSIIKTALGGAIAAAVAAVTYELLAATLFPTSKDTTVLPPDLLGRLLARLIMTTLVGLFSALFLTLSVSRPETPPRSS